MERLLRSWQPAAAATAGAQRSHIVTWSQFVRGQNSLSSSDNPRHQQLEQCSDESRTFSQEECTAGRPWETAVHSPDFDPRPAPWMLMAQLWRKQRLLRSSGITFATCEKPDRPDLLRPSCQKMLHRLGLKQFSATPLPDFDPQACTEFISTYAHPYNYGIVGGRAVTISPRQVMRLTGLPVGSWSWKEYECRGRNQAVLRGILRSLEQPKPKLYSLDKAVFGDREESEAFKEIARLLMERFICKPHPEDSVMPQLVLSMHGSLREKTVMKWAQCFASRMCKSAFYSRVMGKYPFFYGEWLTGLIRLQLSSEGEYEVEASGKQAELETALRDVGKLEIDKVLMDHRIQALEKKVVKIA